MKLVSFCLTTPHELLITTQIGLLVADRLNIECTTKQKDGPVRNGLCYSAILSGTFFSGVSS
jgi:hypothetical protein